ncbi:MAG: cobalamin-dependent protein [Betaproteobacteria bacterium]|nr:cobalamin-dependent protein [Betaproteobacteria bacterium]
MDYLRWLGGVLATRDVPEEHLALSIEWLADYFATAMEEPDAAIVVAALRRTQSRLLEPDNAEPGIYGLMPERWAECDAFESALLAGGRRGAEAQFDRCLAQGHGLVEAELHVIQPALYNIGQKWQDNQVTVAQEHLATAISQSVMTYGLLKSEVPPANGRRTVLACVEGNQHAVGLQMVADAFQLAGWDVHYLGANVPTGALLQHVVNCRPDLLGLSVSFAQQLRVVKDVIARLQAHGADRPPVVIGGLAINQFDSLAGTLGADAWSPDARAAVASGSKLAAHPAAG